MKMSMRFLFLFFTVLFSSQSIAQYFSGEIIYKIDVQPKGDSVDLEEILQSKYGTSASYLITDKHYKSTYYKDGVATYSYTYHDDTKRMYDEYVQRDYITFRDSRKSNVNYYTSNTFRDSTLTILDYDCFLIVTESDHGKTKSYYSDDIRVDYESFKGHQVGNWYNKLKEANGCITLKSITEFKDHYEIREAIKIVQRSVDKSEFALPNSKQIVASYSALEINVELQQLTEDQIQCYRNKLLSAPDLYGRTKKVVSYVKFILTEEGKFQNIEALEEDENGLYKIAIDVINDCGLIFIPGQIGGKQVSSEVYFPVEVYL